jgi:hypothetical protein
LKYASKILDGDEADAPVLHGAGDVEGGAGDGKTLARRAIYIANHFNNWGKMMTRPVSIEWLL